MTRLKVFFIVSTLVFSQITTARMTDHSIQERRTFMSKCVKRQEQMPGYSITSDDRVKNPRALCAIKYSNLHGKRGDPIKAFPLRVPMKPIGSEAKAPLGDGFYEDYRQDYQDAIDAGINALTGRGRYGDQN